MKKKRFTRPVSVPVTDKMFEQIKVIVDTQDIGISDYYPRNDPGKTGKQRTAAALKQEE